MTVQATYGTEHGKYYKGMLPDAQLSNAISKLNKGTQTIEYGVGVFSDGDDGAKLGEAGASAGNFVGFVMRELNQAYRESDTFGVPANNDMSVVTFGTIVVKAVVNVSKDDPVFVRVGATDTGDCSNVAGTGATEAVAVPNAKFTQSVAAGELVVISLGLGG